MKVSGIRTLIIIILLNVLNFAYSQNRSDSPAPKPTVFIFLSETCPICQSYTLTLKNLSSRYSNIEFIGVFPNYYSDEKSIEEFRKEYSIPFKLVKDLDGNLTKKFNATITPEVFVVQEDSVLYSGRIDDSFYAIGKRRNVITSSDLDLALTELTAGKSIKTPRTQAVGCIINSSK